MREAFVTDLVKEVLGPRGKGNPDIMKNDPRDEFIMGVLEPIHTDGNVKDAPHHNYDDPGASTSKQDEIHELDDQDVELSGALSPPLDPQRRASTMGITFTVRSSAHIDLRICLTWARYERAASETREWRRLPRWTILDRHIDPESMQEPSQDIDSYNGEGDKKPEITLKILVKKSKETEYMVSVFLVNNMRADKKIRATTESCIFQPQIRINHLNDTKIIPLSSSRSREDLESDDSVLGYLYRKEHVLARGHLVSAIWKEIDPEGAETAPLDLDYPEARNEPPFKWVDGDQIPDKDKGSFARPPEIRTEYVPLYQIPLPDVDWDPSHGSPPELSAEKLSGMWNPGELKDALYPLYEQYTGWIDRIESDGNDHPSGKKLVEECRDVARRMHEGIDMLTNPANSLYNKDIVLSFCFANKVMSLPATWPKNNDRGAFSYRPFQLGFLLMCLESVVNPESEFRDVCDLMWVPTGTGKTEGYLALAAFVFAYRRRLALRSGDEKTGAGVAVLTRYTLRLLTIQQFRRTLSIITAAESLRVFNDVKGMPDGWRPEGYDDKSRLIWGSTPFSIGLWIGSSMTPNLFKKNRNIDGAKDLLTNPENVTSDNADPAQVLECPACGKDGILAVSKQGLEANVLHTLHFVVKGRHDEDTSSKILKFFQDHSHLNIRDPVYTDHKDKDFFTLSLPIESNASIKDEQIIGMWNGLEKTVSFKLCSTSPARPGYFFNKYLGQKNELYEFDFEIFCPNPQCTLKTTWCGGLPQGRIHGSGTDSEDSSTYDANGMKFPDNNAFMHIQEPFRKESAFFSDRIPINALTSDYQVYQKAPTILISTSDKFARPPYEPKSATIFGNVDHHHARYGYYREQVEEYKDGKKIPALRHPDLILQDELHLADGPLGSMMGIYESAVDALCSEQHAVKYVASTATIKNATEHVKSLFNRRLQIFPPHGSDMDDRFFVQAKKRSIFNDSSPSRLYLGLCAVGRGPLTPLIRIWARLAQSAQERNDDPKKIDPYWTITGYFSAIRELAGAISLYRQDIPDRLKTLSDDIRKLDDDKHMELSGRTKSMELPGVLDILEKEYDKSDSTDCPDALFTTSMFGTGIDISRLGLMLVNGQPKTVSSYIQATGRVGRKRGGLVVTLYRAARARDLNHYEFFSRHHSQIHRFVEPPTIYPFSETLMDRAFGPLLVFMLRNMRNTCVNWGSENSAMEMSTAHLNEDVSKVINMISKRVDNQPDMKKSSYNEKGSVRRYMQKRVDDWNRAARDLGSMNPAQVLKYQQYRVQRGDLKPVVLGDSRYKYASDIRVVYPNAPKSLRAVEEETAFGAS